MKEVVAGRTRVVIHTPWRGNEREKRNHRRYVSLVSERGSEMNTRILAYLHMKAWTRVVKVEVLWFNSLAESLLRILRRVSSCEKGCAARRSGKYGRAQNLTLY